MQNRSILAATAALLALTGAQAQMPDFDAVEIKTTDLGDGIYMLEGLGGNIGVSVGDDGVFVIDDQFAPLADKILAAIAQISDQPVSFVVNTHWHGDHTGANAEMSAAGGVVVAHHNVRKRMAAEGERQSPPEALPVVTFGKSVVFHFNGHTIEAVHPGRAHTDGDAIVFFKEINVIHAGDLLFNGLYPYIDVDSGGSVDGYIATLEWLHDAADEESRIISGHGPAASKQDVAAKIAMLRDARTRMIALIEEGKSLDEIKAADPLAQYHADWAWPFIDGARFTELLHRGLTEW